MCGTKNSICYPGSANFNYMKSVIIICNECYSKDFSVINESKIPKSTNRNNFVYKLVGIKFLEWIHEINERL